MPLFRCIEVCLVPLSVGHRVDDRESTAYSKRITGAAGINPEMARLREVGSLSGKT